MEFRVLGSFEVTADGREIPIRGAKQQKLLALLLVARGQAVSADRLADELWGDDAPSGGGNTLQSLVSKLRRALGPAGAALVTAPAGYRLEVLPESVDIHRFESAAAAGRAALADGDETSAVELLTEALSTWRGRAFDGLADEGTLQREATRLEEARLAAIEDRCEAELRLGRHSELAGELEALVADHPLRERLHGFLMLARYRAGRQADALRAFQHARQTLIDELGLEPSAELRALERSILDQDPSLDIDVPRPAEPGRRRTNLTPELSAFIGREDDVAALAAAVDAHRLVTVVGPGGAGKTRLAREVAERRDDDAWLVELAPVVDPEAVADALSAVVTMDQLRGRPALLVLDNCEHVITEAARLAEHVLRSCDQLRVLATSREALGITGEAIWPAPPMTLDDGVALFTTRAAAASGFELDADSEPAVRDVCARLDGLPLALELAAARTRAIPVGQLAERLDDRFRLLTGGSRTALPRQQTLRAVVEWSYDLLFDDERRVFERMSVFAGGCSLAAAEEVCAGDDIEPADVLDLLAHLVDKSLVIADRTGDEVRYDLLQTLALFGQERLLESGDAEATRARHAAWFGRLAAAAQTALRGRHQARLLEQVHAEIDNVRAAIVWAVEGGDAETAQQLAGGPAWTWSLSGRAEEAHRLLEQALDCPGPSQPATRAVAAIWSGWIAANAGLGIEAAMHRAEEALALWREADDPVGLADSEVLYGIVVAGLGRSEEALALFDDAARIHRARTGPWHRAIAAYAAGRAAQVRGDLERAEQLQAEAVDHHAAAGLLWAVATMNGDVAALAERRNDLATAIARLEQAHRAAVEVGLHGEASLRLVRLGSLWLQTGDLDRAEAAFADAFALADETGFASGKALALNGRANVHRAAGRLDEALASAQASCAIYRRSDTAAGAWLTFTTLGLIAEEQGDLPAARRSHLDGLDVARRVGGLAAVAWALEGLASVTAAEGRHERAALLLGHADRLRSRYSGPWVRNSTEPRSSEHETVAARIASEVRSVLGDERSQAAFRRGAETDLDELLSPDVAPPQRSST